MKILTIVLIVLLLTLLPYQLVLLEYSFPRLLWNLNGFVIASCITVAIAMLLALPIKKVVTAGTASASVILFSGIFFIVGLGIKNFLLALIIGSGLGAIGIFIPIKFRSASSVLLGLCVFSWFYMILICLPITMFYIEYFHRMEGNFMGSLFSMVSVVKNEFLTAISILPSLALYLIIRFSKRTCN